MTDFQLAGRMVQGIRRPSRRHPEGRVCVRDGCRTVLSVYNPSRFCSQHETTSLPRTFGRQRLRSA